MKKEPMKKEPEDIFSGMDKAPQKPPSAVPPSVPRQRFPLKWFVAALVILMILGGIAYAAWAFLIAPKQRNVVAPTPRSVATIVETPPPVAAPPVEVPPPTTMPPAGITIPVPTSQFSPSEGVDTDGDGLTDVEEPYYDTDLTKSDTDGDGFSDGTEVLNLFDSSKKGGKLTDATFVSTLLWNGWSFLAPKPWSVIADSTSREKAAIATGTAGRFLLERMPNSERLSLDAWLEKNGFLAPIAVQTKIGINGRQSSDRFTIYLPETDSVLKITYDLNGDAAVEYRTSLQMIVASMSMK